MQWPNLRLHKPIPLSHTRVPVIVWMNLIISTRLRRTIHWLEVPLTEATLRVARAAPARPHALLARAVRVRVVLVSDLLEEVQLRARQK